MRGLLTGRGCKVVINDVGASMRGDTEIEDPAHDLAAEIRAGSEMFVAMGGEWRAPSSPKVGGVPA